MVPGTQYSASSVQTIFKEAVKKVGITKRAMHTRQSFGSHLRYLQSLMGHESSKTTAIYTHITTKGFDQIKSLLNILNICRKTSNGTSFFILLKAVKTLKFHEKHQLSVTSGHWHKPRPGRRKQRS